MKILNLLKKLLSEFDPYGVEHGERVAELSVRLATAAGIDPESQLMRDIQTAALIHDVGKVGVPESVRRQQGKFLPSERTAMQLHVIYGAELLELVINGTINKRVVEFVKFHHKDFNGGGYPADPLQGAEIPIGARIIRICDTYDAMGHDRGYRQGLPPASCLQEMTDDQIKSQLFDPELFRLFLEMMKDV